MSGGRYTAFHVYQNLSFPEADRASAPPYRFPEYRCAHSQRGYLFQFDSMVERNHFDAATTTCCDEPVMNFGNKPQFASSARPMNPRDCSHLVAARGCETLEVSIEDSPGMCADESSRIRRIKIRCPSACPEFSGILSGGSFRGRYGTFRSLGMEAGEILILDYRPDSSLMDRLYDSCAGTRAFNEEFCNGRNLSFEVRGGLDLPGGCGCDCCGRRGGFPPPIMNITAPAAIHGGHENTANPQMVVTVDQACPGAEITGVFHGVSGSGPVQWDAPTVYNSDGTARFVTREQPAIGEAVNPSCCGGQVEWIATDGCGGLRTAITEVTSGAGTPGVWPVDGAVLYDGDGCSFSGTGACSHSAFARLDINTQCLANVVQSDLFRYDGLLARNLESTLTLDDWHDCSGCCGNGNIALDFSNGCGLVIHASYPVRRRMEQSAYSDCIGRMFMCERFFRFFAPIGYYYRIAVADLMCDGGHGEFSNPDGFAYTGLSECLALINGPAAASITGSSGCAGLTGGDTCCFYSDNGLSGLEFRSSVVSVSGRKCCVIETGNGSWVNGGPAAGCCPN